MHIGQAYEALQWVGVISLSAIVFSGVMPLLRKPFDPSRSVSQAWSETKRIRRALGVVLTVFGAGFSASVIGWFIPTYQLPSFMYFITAAAYLGLLAIAWVPIFDKPTEHPIHHPHFLGGMIGATGIALYYAAILLAPSTLPPVSHNLTVLALVFSVCWPLFFLRRIHDYFLILECLFVLLFVLVVFSLTLGW